MSSHPRFGLAIPNCREGLYYPPSFAGPRAMLDTGIMAEELGYDSVWVNDHFTAPKYVENMWKEAPNFYDPLITLAALATTTQRIRLGVAVVVMPIREPLVLAKQASTLDALSNGRLILGAGLGAYKEEFEATVPSTNTAERPGLLDERLAALVQLLVGSKTTFNGRYTKFVDVELHPKPVQDPLPVYIGGNAEKAIERVVKFGNGWIPVGLGPTEIEEKVRELRRKASLANREQSSIEIAPQFTVSIAGSYEKAVNTYKSSAHYKHFLSLQTSTLKGRSIDNAISKNLMGTPEDIIKSIEKFVEAGVQHFTAMIFPARRLEEYIRSVKIFAKEVIPSFRS